MKKHLRVTIACISVLIAGTHGLWPTGNTTLAAQATKMRWDIIKSQPSAPPAITNDILPGGVAYVLASNNAVLTLTGSGTFGPTVSDPVTGGGTWALGAGTGTYTVTGLVSFVLAPGGPFDGGSVDKIGILADTRAGLAALRIAYSDGSQGTLYISCTLGGTPAGVVEGVICDKGAVAFWNRQFGLGALGIQANTTLFHVVR